MRTTTWVEVRKNNAELSVPKVREFDGLYINRINSAHHFLRVLFVRLYIKAGKRNARLCDVAAMAAARGG